MKPNTPYTELKQAISNLEKEQVLKQAQLKEQFRLTYESLNPFIIIKNSLKSVFEAPEIRSDIVGLVLPLLAGLFGKKASAGSRRTSFVAQAGILLLEVLNRYVVNHPEVVRPIAGYVTNLFRKKNHGEVE